MSYKGGLFFNNREKIQMKWDLHLECCYGTGMKGCIVDPFFENNVNILDQLIAAI